MASEPSLLEMPDGEFRTLVSRLDEGIGLGAVTVRTGSPGFRQLIVEDSAVAGFDPDTWEKYRPAISELAPLIFFAFEGASDGVIRDWFLDDDGSESEPSAETDAGPVLERVRMIRDLMPHARAVWKARSESILPTLAGIRYRPGAPTSEGSPTVLVEISSAPPDHRSYGREQGSSITLELLSSDIAYLRRVLARIEREVGG